MQPPLAFEPPRLLCEWLPAFSLGDWMAINRAFATMPTCELRQGWNRTTEPDFQPSWASVGLREDHDKSRVLWVYARLPDLDIGNAATNRNQRTWELGDVFEIFLAPRDGRSYFEFHVTPENQVLECEFPIPRNPTAPLPLLAEPLIQSWTNVSTQQWEVLAAIPFAPLGAATVRGWNFSFCRYDAAGGRDPVLSSSSPHRELNFHRREEWGELILPN